MVQKSPHRRPNWLASVLAWNGVEVPMRIHFKSEDRPAPTMSRFGDRGFTLIELLVVIAIIA
ncbi:MAG: type IV pilin protein, partial [Limisphaerales bacterium]